MSRPLTAITQIARNVLTQATGWYEFVRIPLSSGSEIRVVRNSEAIDANGCRWQAASLELGLPSESESGELEDLTITVPNVSRIPASYVLVDGEIIGREASVYWQHESMFGSFDTALEWPTIVLGVSMTEAVATFRCGHPAKIQRGPRGRFNRTDFPQLLPIPVS